MTDMIDISIFKKELAVAQEKKEAFDVFEQLSEQGLNPKDYRASDHDYRPFLIHIAIEGELRNFLDTLKGNYKAVASVFRVIDKAYLEELVSKYRTSYGIARAKVETKMVAIGYIARNTSEAEQDGMIKAFREYENGRQQLLAKEKSDIAKLQQ